MELLEDPCRRPWRITGGYFTVTQPSRRTLPHLRRALAIAWVVVLAPGYLAFGAEPNPIRTINLRNWGYTGRVIGVVESSSGRLVAAGSMAFIDEGLLAFVVLKQNKDAGTPPPRERIYALVVGAEKGDLRASRDLGVITSDKNWLFTNNANQVVIAVEERLYVFSTDLEVIRERRFASQPWRMTMSPDGGVLFVEFSASSRPTKTYELLDAATLETLQSWEDSGEKRYLHSGRHLVVMKDLWGKDPGFAVRTSDGEWRDFVLPAVLGSSKKECAQVWWPGFVSSHVLVVPACEDRLFWLDIESGSWSETAFGKNHRKYDWPITSSRNGTHFAVSIVWMRPIWIPGEGHGRFEWTESVQVYNISDRRPVYFTKLKVSWLFGASFAGPLALSPQAKSLAIFNHETDKIEIHRLPPLQ